MSIGKRGCRIGRAALIFECIQITRSRWNIIKAQRITVAEKVIIENTRRWHCFNIKINNSSLAVVTVVSPINYVYSQAITRVNWMLMTQEYTWPTMVLIEVLYQFTLPGKERNKFFFYISSLCQFNSNISRQQRYVSYFIHRLICPHPLS